MFTARNNLATNEELDRQMRIQNVILKGQKPTIFIEKKAAAVYGSPRIDIVLQSKVRKAIDVVLDFVGDEDIESCANSQMRKQILEYLRGVSLEIGDRVQLHRKLPILALHSEPIPQYQFELEVKRCDYVNIADFEQFAFNNYTKYRYLVGTTFASYLYQNILYSMNARTSEELQDNNSWQAKLALLIDQTNFSEYVAKTVFYQDTVQYRGIVYDSSFVPKYDVNSLKHQDIVSDTITDHKLIKYWSEVDIRRIQQIPEDKMSIFRTFPFKDGHIINDDGSITYLNAYYNPKQSVRMMIGDLCNIHDIEFAIDTAARTLDLDDVVYYAMHSKNLNQMAKALMIIRRMVGDLLTIQQIIKIKIPTEYEILSWTTHTCDMSTIVLPPNFKSADSLLYTAQIQDIAQSCFNKMGACIICSSYHLPEIYMGEVYDSLTTDAEKYVFYTLILQEYNYSMYFIARKRLNPEFGSSVVDMSRYPKFRGQYPNTTLAERLDALTEPLVKPSDMSANILQCPPYKCIDMYEFSDPQLNELVTTGDTVLNDDQLTAYITLLLT